MSFASYQLARREKHFGETSEHFLSDSATVKGVTANPGSATHSGAPPTDVGHKLARFHCVRIISRPDYDASNVSSSKDPRRSLRGPPAARGCASHWGVLPDLLDRLFGHSKIFGGANGWWPARQYGRPAPLEPVTYERFPAREDEQRTYHTLENLQEGGGKASLSPRLKELAAQKNLRVVIPRD
ncbi:hypothetical protein AAVH_39893 [Aphelenchoides avenae]|nr:hypothetical protein AAVH_39893 [Aphelenchus avenae]